MKKKAQKTANAIPANMTPQAILKKAINYHLNGQKKQSPNFDAAYQAAISLKMYEDLDQKYLKLVKATPADDWASFFEFYQHIIVLNGKTGNYENIIMHIRTLQQRANAQRRSDKMNEIIDKNGIFNRIIESYSNKADWKSLLELEKLLFIYINSASRDYRKDGWYQMLETAISQLERGEIEKSGSGEEKSEK
jgi:hypothetical protein